MKYLLLASFFTIILACNTQKNTSQHISNSGNSSKYSDEDKDYFNAAGNEPFWQIDISRKQIKFKSVDSSFNLTTPYVKPLNYGKSNTNLYQSTSEEGDLIVELTAGNCSDNMSDILHTYSVEVKVKTKNAKEYTNFKGCGNYTPNYKP